MQTTIVGAGRWISYSVAKLSGRKDFASLQSVKDFAADFVDQLQQG
jgi:hypothetical protein